MASTVVADIGGTSSRWGVLRTGQEPLIVEGLPGFNPAVGDPDAFVRAVRERFNQDKLGADELFVYGAGCGSQDRAARMAEALLSIWPAARIDVSSDLLGAAHGLLSTRPGLVLILGTGMNAGWYDGSAMHQPMPSLGYILGDEGSGADIGKELLRTALHGRMPPELIGRVFPDGVRTAEVIERLYRGPSPQVWLASFTALLAPVIDHPWVRELVLSRYALLTGSLVKYFSEQQRSHVFATGSVAHGLSALLRKALAEQGMELTDVQPSPLPGLLRFRSGLVQ